MNGWSLREMLGAGPVVSDGAMGTSLLARGVASGTCFDELNVSDPAAVGAIHRAFADAGAMIITTNTFGANRFRLGSFGHERRVGEINRAGASVALEQARERGGLVAGSVGPLGARLAPYGRVPAVDAFAAFVEQIGALAEAGVDLVLIETQNDLAEVEQAVAAARQVGDLGIIASMAFARDDRTLLGQTPVQVAERLVSLGVDGIGVNCSEGPAQVLRIVRAMRPFAADLPMLAQPNAGSPQQVSGRYLYPATPGYLADHARALIAEGVRVVGGCCGTGPEHIAAIAEVASEPATHDPVDVIVVDEEGEGAHEVRDEASALAGKFARGEFVIAVEMDPPRGFSTGRMVAAAQTMADAGADAIDVADSPMARMRMSPWAACRVIEEEAGIETVLHFPTRGRNLLRLQGDLLAVHALGLRNIFVCMGDPVAIGDYPGATDNVDVVPTGFMRSITGSFNRGEDRSGASIGEPTRFVVGCAVSPHAHDLSREVRLLAKKIEAGASFALSQPVYAIEPLLALHTRFVEEIGEPVSIPICVGVLPLLSPRHAGFLHNEVPGISIPDGVRARMDAAGERAEAEGIAMAKELVEDLRPHAAGIYLMPPFERFDLAADVVEAARALG